MDNLLIENTDVLSYTHISAVFCAMYGLGSIADFWKYQMYGNLCYVHDTNTMHHCGKYAPLSYLDFEEKEWIILRKLPQNTSCEKLKNYLNQNYLLLLPINTKLLGCTERAYIHNVLIVGYENDGFLVYDFWAPHLVWMRKKVCCQILFSSIDFSNAETVQMVYAFKCNDIREYKRPTLTELQETYQTVWVSRDSDSYQQRSNAYGFDAYITFCEHLKQLDEFSLQDCQNLHVIYDHLRFSRDSLTSLFSHIPAVKDWIIQHNSLIDSVNKIRLTAYKYYLTCRKAGALCNDFAKEICMIAQEEGQQIRKIVELKGEEYVIR